MVLLAGPGAAKPGKAPLDSGLRRNSLPRTRSGDGGVVWTGRVARLRRLARTSQRTIFPSPLCRLHPPPPRRSGASRNPVRRPITPAPPPDSTRCACCRFTAHHPQARPLAAQRFAARSGPIDGARMARGSEARWPLALRPGGSCPAAVVGLASHWPGNRRSPLAAVSASRQPPHEEEKNCLRLSTNLPRF